MFRGVFRTKASKLEKALVDAGFRVTINESKPRKGTFAVKLDGIEDPVVELLAMPRPFSKLRELDIDDLAQSIVAKFN